VVVAIDFGTTSSGYAYSFTKEPECIHVMRWVWQGKGHQVAWVPHLCGLVGRLVTGVWESILIQVEIPCATCQRPDYRFPSVNHWVNSYIV
jgi:hypothetical protein